MRVVSLAEVAPEELQGVFQQEIEHWQKGLFWDYRPAVELIGKHMRSQSLPGHAVRSAPGAAVGYCYYLIDHPVGYIGNLYVRGEFAGTDAYPALLQAVVNSLRWWGDVKRIECQIFPFNCDLFPLFEGHGFRTVQRHFLCLPLECFDGDIPCAPCETGFRIVPWERTFFAAAADVIYNSYRDSPDYGLCRDYQSREGCIRFLRNLVDNPGCGVFTPDTSYVAFDKQGELCAILVTSRIAAETGMIPQISVRRDCQNKGLGTLLLFSYFREARKRGLKRITLSVSEANQRACQLYLRLGFQKAKEFQAFIWEGGTRASEHRDWPS